LTKIKERNQKRKVEKSSQGNQERELSHLASKLRSGFTSKLPQDKSLKNKKRRRKKGRTGKMRLFNKPERERSPYV